MSILVLSVYVRIRTELLGKLICTLCTKTSLSDVAFVSFVTLMIML